VDERNGYSGQRGGDGVRTKGKGKKGVTKLGKGSVELWQQGLGNRGIPMGGPLP